MPSKLSTSMNMPSSLQSLLTNRFVLYAMLFLSVLTVIGYIALSDYLAIGVFVIAGIVASFFTKNMILILGVAILAAAALGVRGTVTKAVEAMTNKGDATKKPDADADADSDADATVDDDADAAPADADATSSVSPHPTNKKPSTGTKKQGFRDMGNKIRPAKVNASDDLKDDEIIGKRIDYAATIEQAYDHLESMLGDKGMAGLTGETERLIKQQKTLMETLNTMAPVLETAKSTLGALNMTGLFGMAGGAKKDKVTATQSTK